MAIEDFSIDSNIDEAIRQADRALAFLPSDREKMFKRIGLAVGTEATKNAPISPTKAQGGGPNANPGRLMASIKSDGNSDEARVFVPSQSPAGAYAEFIHDGRYKLGRGSVAKLSRGYDVGRKYIARAIKPGIIIPIIENTLRIIGRRLKGF